MIGHYPELLKMLIPLGNAEDSWILRRVGCLLQRRLIFNKIRAILAGTTLHNYAAELVLQLMVVNPLEFTN